MHLSLSIILNLRIYYTQAFLALISLLPLQDNKVALRYSEMSTSNSYLKHSCVLKDKTTSPLSSNL